MINFKIRFEQRTENRQRITLVRPTQSRNIEFKDYELKDHLGNVRFVFDDVKEVNNYYPFGILYFVSESNSTKPNSNNSEPQENQKGV